MAVLAAFFSTSLLGVVLILLECGKQEFSSKLAALLSDRLDAEVSLAPIRVHSLVFLDCPSMQIRDRSGRWTFRAQQVSLELQTSGILTGGLGFRSVLAHEGELWLGGDPMQNSGTEGSADSCNPRLSALPWWLQGKLQDLERIPMDAIEIKCLRIKGHEPTPEACAFAITAAASGTMQDGRLEWKLAQGRFETPGHDSWSLVNCSGDWTQNGLRVEGGMATNPGGATVSFASQEPEAPGDLSLRVEAQGVKFRPSGGELEDALGPISSANAVIKGNLLVRFPDVQRFHFQGDVTLDGLNLGKSKVFRLLSGQTGEERLRHPEAHSLTGYLECTPGVIRLTRLASCEKGLFRVEGWLSIVAEEVLGVFDLALPAPMVGKIPGGKPKGFSYPAAGWSWARLRVEGKSDRWQEDLSQRLMAQISRDIPVKAGPPLQIMPVGGTGSLLADGRPREASTAASRRKAETMEKLFYSLIEN